MDHATIMQNAYFKRGHRLPQGPTGLAQKLMPHG
jgi:hypothetical protein